jgi:hypothetical protein
MRVVWLGALVHQKDNGAPAESAVKDASWVLPEAS